MDLILVRHGDVEAAPGLCLGQTDAPLSASGFGAVQQLAATWTQGAPRFLFSSDLKRAQQAAQIFAARFAIEPLFDARLREVNLGDWDGKRWEDVMRSDAARYEHWSANWVIQEAPGGESFADAIRRTGAWLASVLSSTHDEDTVLAVAHAGSIRALLCHRNISGEIEHPIYLTILFHDRNAMFPGLVINTGDHEIPRIKGSRLHG